MAFTILQTVTDKQYGFDRPQIWIDLGVSNLSDGLPIGLLLALTYTN